MVKVRIRYKQLEDGTLMSPPILAGHNIVCIFLDEDRLTYSIRTLEGSTILENIPSVSPQMMRIDAKKSLKRLGANFKDEVRKPYQVRNV